MESIQEAGKGRIRELALQRQDLRQVPSDLLVEAVARMETVHLERTYITMKQLFGIFSMVARRRSSTLKKVFFERYFLRMILPIDRVQIVMKQYHGIVVFV